MVQIGPYFFKPLGTEYEDLSAYGWFLIKLSGMFWCYVYVWPGAKIV